MKTLVVYFSLTGNTETVAEKIANYLQADSELLKDKIKWKGFFGYWRAGRYAMKKMLSKVEPLEKNIADYEQIIIGGPIWGWTLSTPIRTFLENEKEKLQGKKLVFFCTQGGNGAEKAFAEMEKITNIKQENTLILLTKDVKKGEIDDKVKEFANSLG